MKTDATIRRIEKEAKRLGYTVSVKYAETMSVYVACERGDDEIVIRVSDHGACYPPSRGERRVDVNPEQGGIQAAINALRDPNSIAPYEPVALSDDQKDALREQAAQESRFGSSWRDLRAALEPEWIERFKAGGCTKRAARAIASEVGIGAGKMYAALTNGKRM